MDKLCDSISFLFPCPSNFVTVTSSGVERGNEWLSGHQLSHLVLLRKVPSFHIHVELGNARYDKGARQPHYF
jgi:hypothetical protein